MTTRLTGRLARRILTALVLVMLGSFTLPGGSMAYGKDGADDAGSDTSGGGSGNSGNSGPGSNNSGSGNSEDEVDHRLKLEKTYDDGYRETVDRGVYILTDAKGRTVIRRTARTADVKRFETD